MAVLAKRITTHFLLSKALEETEVEMPPGVLVRRLTVEDIPLMEEINPDLISDLEREKLKQGLVGFLTFLEGVPAGYCFMQWKGKYSLQGTGRWLHLCSGEIVLLAAYTAEWARGKHVLYLMSRFSLYDFSRQGFRKAYALVNSRNEPSLRSFLRQGFTNERTMKALHLLGLVVPLP